MSYTTPRSVQNLEDEIAELEKLQTGEVDPEVDEEDEEVELGGEDVIAEAPQEDEVEEEATSKEEISFKKRYSDLRRHNQKVADELKEATEALATLKKQKASAGLPSAEEAESWAKDNPKAAAIIRAIALEQTSPTSEELSVVKEKLNRAEQEARILKSHPDFEEITAEDEFHNWAEKQPERVQSLIYSKDADEVSWAITLYKDTKSVKPDLKKEAAKSVSSKSTSAEPKTQGKGRFTESMVSKMSLSEYEKNEEAINQSMRDGTFSYDLSGAAR